MIDVKTVRTKANSFVEAQRVHIRIIRICRHGFCGPAFQLGQDVFLKNQRRAGGRRVSQLERGMDHTSGSIAQARRCILSLQPPKMESPDRPVSEQPADVSALDCHRDDLHAPHSWTAISVALLTAVPNQRQEARHFSSRSSSHRNMPALRR